MGKLKIGGKCAAGHEIAGILGQSSRATVYTTVDNHLRWQIHENEGDPLDYQHGALNHFNTLLTRNKQFATGGRKQENFTALGKALFSALNLPEAELEQERIGYFTDVEALINDASAHRAKMNYIGTAIVTAPVLMIALFLVFVLVLPEYEAHFIGLIFGALGACVSILHRSPKMKVDSGNHSSAIRMESSLRVILGSIFGFLFVIACQANLVVGVLSENNPALMIFSAVAGFSERLVPDLLRKLERA